MAKMDWRRIWERTIGMRLALWLDKRNPEWCWAALCTDLGLGWGLTSWRESAKNSASCRADCEKNGSCWCGKIRKVSGHER